MKKVEKTRKIEKALRATRKLKKGSSFPK